MRVPLMVGMLISAIVRVFATVAISMLRSPEAPQGVPGKRPACVLGPVPRDAGRASFLPEFFAIRINGDYGGIYLRMTGQSSRLNVLPRENGTASCDNVTDVRPSLTLDMARDGTFDATLWHDILRGPFIAVGLGRCSLEGTAA